MADRRYTTKTLFNKNHIKITSTNCPTNPEYRKITNDIAAGGSSNYYGGYSSRQKIGEKTEELIVCESPLGFYYKKMVKIPINKEQKDNNKSTSSTTVTFCLSKQTYKLTYFTSYGESSIGGRRYPYTPSEDGLRPWELCPEDKSMPDHFITDLFNLLERIFDECRYEKISKIDKGKENLSEFKSSLYLTIFGNKKGPRKQTDEEKILSHGFDLKESFRKPKENGK